MATNQYNENKKRHGLWVEKSDFFERKFETNYQNGKKHGKAKVYCTNTKKLEMECNYSHGRLNGSWIAFHSNGKIQSEIMYKNGKESSSEKYYDINGVLTEEELFIL